MLLLYNISRHQQGSRRELQKSTVKQSVLSSFLRACKFHSNNFISSYNFLSSFRLFFLSRSFYYAFLSLRLSLLLNTDGWKRLLMHHWNSNRSFYCYKFHIKMIALKCRWELLCTRPRPSIWVGNCTTQAIDWELMKSKLTKSSAE